ncbi:MAG TPA: hypothetical protein VN626_00240 [Clostridia bacterium]|nr:hypothetical protein [Clostridia bacterium]
MSLKYVVANIVDQIINGQYAHIKYPAAYYAQVVKRQQQGENYIYSLRLLSSTLQVDNSVPEIPNVKSKLRLDVDDFAAVVLPYGQLAPFIVGEAVL